MASTFMRCQYIAADNKQQCNTWFDSDTSVSKTLCPLHCDAIDASTAANHPETKTAYIQQVNDDDKFCSTMDDVQLTNHIFEIEKVIARERTRLSTARANMARRVEKMSDEQRAELRKMKVSEAVKSSDKKPRASSSKKKDFKSMSYDEKVQFMMNSYAMTEEQAKGLVPNV
jgi:hypothetical protein